MLCGTLSISTFDFQLSIFNALSLPMPELPEIEHLKRTLEPVLLGARVLDVRLRRSDIASHCEPLPLQAKRKRTKVSASDLLKGATIASLERLGKNLAIIGDNQRVLC